MLYAGLLSQAHGEGLARVRTSILQIPTVENGHLAIIKAEVETTKGLFEAGRGRAAVRALAFLLQHGTIPRLRLDLLLKTSKPRLERHETTRSVEDLGWTARLIREVSLAIEIGPETCSLRIYTFTP